MKKILGLFLYLTLLGQAYAQVSTPATPSKMQIIYAMYGTKETNIDVTDKIIALMPKDSSKFIFESKNYTATLGDPLSGASKDLSVLYKDTNGVMRFASVKDNVNLTLDPSKDLDVSKIDLKADQDAIATKQTEIDKNKADITTNEAVRNKYNTTPFLTLKQAVYQAKSKWYSQKDDRTTAIARFFPGGEKNPNILENSVRFNVNNDTCGGYISDHQNNLLLRWTEMDGEHYAEFDEGADVFLFSGYLDRNPVNSYESKTAIANINSLTKLNETYATDLTALQTKLAIHQKIKAVADNVIINAGFKGKGFTFDPSVGMTPGRVYYQDGIWKLNRPGHITVVLKINTPGEFYIQFSPTLPIPPARSFAFAEKNTYSIIVGDDAAKKVFLVKNGVDTRAIDGQYTDSKVVLSTDIYCWASIEDNKKISFGIGQEPGKNTTISWVIDPKNADDAKNIATPAVLYVGFGGSKKCEFKEINVGATIVLNPPTGFMAEPGFFDRITVGSKDGNVEAWALDGEGIPCRYNPFSGAPFDIPSLDDAKANPWSKQGEYILNDIAASSYGDMVGINSEGTAVMYDWTGKSWVKLASSIKPLKNITVADKDNIYASSEDALIYKYAKGNWERVSTGVFVAAGMTTDKKLILIGISDNGKAYEFVNNAWKPLFGVADNLVEVTIGNEENIFGINKDGLLYKLNSKTREWESEPGMNGKQAAGFSSISANAAGTIFAIDSDGENYHKGDAGVKIPAAAATPAADKAAATKAATQLTRSQAFAKGNIKPKAIKTGKAITGKKLKRTKTPVKSSIAAKAAATKAAAAAKAAAAKTAADKTAADKAAADAAAAAKAAAAKTAADKTAAAKTAADKTAADKAAADAAAAAKTATAKAA